MLVTALRAFQYAHDGIHIRTIPEGEAFDCRPELVDGLGRAGYIEPAATDAAEKDQVGLEDAGAEDGVGGDEVVVHEAETLGDPPSEGGDEIDLSARIGPEKSGEETLETQSAVPIPDDWRTALNGTEMISLAAKLTFNPIRNSRDAIAAIEAEILRRSSGE